MTNVAILRDETAAAAPSCQTTPSLSILIPVYNVAEYLEFCVQSILQQISNYNIEILLLDDCSTDGSRALCVRLYANHPEKLKLLYHDVNAGLSAARNSLLDAARGDYVWFLDSDDYLMPGCIKELNSIFDTHGPDMVLCDYQKRRFIKKKSFPGRGRKLESDNAKLVSGVFQHRKMYSWARISKRSLWGSDLRFPAGRTFEDIATTPWLLLRAKSYYYVPQSWVFYRTRDQSIMTSFSRTKGHFDALKHDDMASAMLGFKPLLIEKIGPHTQGPSYYASHFLAKEYTKLAARFCSARNNPLASCGLKPATLYPYFEKMQQCSPYDYNMLSRAYLKRLRIFSFLAFRKAARLATKGRSNAG